MSSPKQTSEPPDEKRKISIHIVLPEEDALEVEQLANYAASIEIIPSDNRGNMTKFIGWCIDLGREYLRQAALKRRKFI